MRARHWWVLMLPLIGLCFSQHNPIGGWSSLEHHPTPKGVTFDGLEAWHLALFALGHLITAGLGLSLTWPALKDTKAPFALKAIGSFIVGYVASLIFIRLISLFRSGPFLTWGGLALLVALTIIWLKPARKELASAIRSDFAPAMRLDLLIGLGALGILFLYVLVHSVAPDNGGYSWVGHGQHHYAYYLNDLKKNPTALLPILKLHQDELLFQHLLTSGTSLAYQAIIPMWLTLAAIKVSAGALLYCLFRRLEVTRATSLLGTAFLLVGSLGLDPLKYLAFFDSSSPLGYVVHAGRIVGIPIALLWFTEVLQWNVRRRWALPPRFFVLVGSGMMLTTISNVLTLLVFAPVWLWLRFRWPAGKTFGWQRQLTANGLGVGIAALGFFISLLYFALPPGCRVLGMRPGSLYLFFGFVLIAYAWHVTSPGGHAEVLAQPTPERREALGALKRFFLPALFVALVLGNVGANNPIGLGVAALLDRSGLSPGMEVVHPPHFYLPRRHRTQYLTDSRTLNGWGDYDRSSLHFLGYYGAFFLAGLAALLVLSRRDPESCLDDERRREFLRDNLVFLVGYLSMLFLPVNFIWNFEPWYKTRFFEIPFYSLFFVFFCVMDGAGALAREGARFYALVFTSLPLLFTGRGRVLSMNWEMLRGMLPR